MSHSLDAHTSGPARQFPDPPFEPVYRLRRYAPFWFPVRREAEPQKLPLPWPRHRTLQLVYLELERSFVPTTPAADFCRPVRMDRSTLSPDSGTNGRSPEVSSTAFGAQPPDLQPVPLMDMDFAVNGPFVQHRMPLIRFLYIGSRFCSTLLSDPASRRRPCASLSLHLHQVVKRTFTFELSNMLGTPYERAALSSSPES